MTELDMLRTVLAERASRAPDTDAVLAATADVLQRLRSRRKAAAAAATAAVGVLVGGVTVLGQTEPDQQPTVQTTASQQAPIAPGIRPELPFSVTVPSGYRLSSWSVDARSGLGTFQDGTDEISVTLSENLTLPVTDPKSPPAKRTTVHGLPAELHQLTPVEMALSWQIVPGKWASVTGRGEQQVRSVAESMTTTPSDPPATGVLRAVPTGFSVNSWFRGATGITTVVFCPDQQTGKAGCAELAFNPGTAPDVVDTPVRGQRARLSAPDAAGLRQTPDGQILVRQVDEGHWTEVTSGTSTTTTQLREISLAASAG